MATPAKFLFDRSFERHMGDNRGADDRSYSREDIDAACAQSHANGQIEGEKAAYESIQQTTAIELRALTMGIESLLEKRQIFERDIRRQAVHLAHTIASKLATRLVRSQPEQEITALFESCLDQGHEEPRIVIRAAADSIERLKPMVEPCLAAALANGSVILITDEAMAPGDCRIEWADGGAERRISDIATRVDAMIEDYLALAERIEAGKTGDPHAAR